MKKSLIENTANSESIKLRIRRPFVISMAIAIISLNISPISFADENILIDEGVRTQVVSTYARYSQGTLSYGAMIKMTESPESDTLPTIKNRRDTGIKSIAGISTERDDCTKEVEVHEMSNGLFAKMLTQMCTREIQPGRNSVFFKVGSSVAAKYYSVANNAAVTGANFLQVTGGL